MNPIGIWAALIGGPIAGAALVVGYVITRFGRHDPIGASAVAIHGLALVLVLLAVPATLRLREDHDARRLLLAAWILCVLPCAAWVLNSLGVVLQPWIGSPG